MKPGGKIRIVVSIVIMMILACFVTSFLYVLYQSAIKKAMVDTGVKDIMIDGSDFTPVFKLFEVVLNIALIAIVVRIFAVILLIGGLILLIPFRLIGLNKKRCIQKSEYKIVKCAYVIILILSLLMGGILTRFLCLMPLFLLNAIWGLLALVLCVVPLKTHSSDSGSGDDRDTEADNHGTAG